MKKSNIIFAIYTIVIITGISLFLVFYPEFSQKHDYAKSISLNCPREITFEVKDRIVLPENFISINPSEMIDELRVEVYTKSSKTNPDDLNINELNISSLSTGFYYIKFIVPGKNFDIYDTLVVHVVENNSLNYIFQNQTSLQSDKEYSFADIFDINIENDYSISYDKSKINIKDDKISTYSPSNLSMEFVFDFEFYKYISINTMCIQEAYDPYEPTIPEDPLPETPTEPNDPTDPDEPDDPADPEDPSDPDTPTEPSEPETPTNPDDPIENPTTNLYTIEILNHDTDNITFVIDGTKTLFKLHYQVKYDNELCSYQAVTAKPSDDIYNVTSDAPYIYVKYTGIKGTFTVTINYENVVTKTITVTFK